MGSAKINMFLTFCTLATLLVGPVHGQLTPGFYSATCPSFQSTVSSALASALNSDARIGASMLRLFFHDCAVVGQGCDGSVLLDDLPSVQGEKNAGPNAGSLRGFSLVDNIKATLEFNCPGIVSCADILATLARDAVVRAGGPSWNVELGRRDSTSASFTGANNLPNPTFNANQLINYFRSIGLNPTDLVALSGAHTIGRSQCIQVSNRLFNFQGSGGPDPSMDPNFVNSLQQQCPQGTNGLVNFDLVTPTRFDSQYYNNLLLNRGLLGSDQTLAGSGQTATLVNGFTSQTRFFNQFVSSMIKLGRVGVQTGSRGQIRTVCGRVNSS